MIEFRDFVPRMLGPAGFLGEPDFQTLQDALDACNQWIDANGVEVLHVETVVLPKVHHPTEQGSRTSTSARTTSGRPPGTSSSGCGSAGSGTTAAG